MKRSIQHSDNPYDKNDTASNDPPSSSSPTSSTSKLETDQIEKKWRPLDIFTWGVTNSPRLIGWNDEDFRKIVEEHRKQRLKDPSIPNVEETGFGLMGMLANALKEAVYKKTDFDDLKSDLKKIEDSTSNTNSSSARAGASGSSSPLSLKDLSSDEKSPKVERRKDSSSSIDIIGSSVNLKDMKVYQNVLSTIKYQRDAYIMGTEYADQRKAEREQMENLPTVTEDGVSDTDTVERSSHQTALHSQDHTIQNTSSTSSTSTGTLSYKSYLDRYPNAVIRAPSSSSSLANTQLTGLLEWFIPSQTMHNALLPTVLWTIAPPTSQLPEGGPLRKKINRSVCDLIPLSQDLLDATMKSSILWVLSDESWRESVKGSSRNYLSSTDGRSGITDGSTNIHPSTSSSSFASHHDTGSSLGSGSGGRVVITKTIRMNR